MKRILSNVELWQKKRRELPVNGNPETDWQQMRSLLDKQMPVQGVIKKPSRFQVPKWGLHVFVGISVVVAVYMGYHLYTSKNHGDITKSNTQQIHPGSPAPAANGTSPAQGTIKSPSTGTNKPGNTPVITGAPPLFINQAKPGNDTTLKGRQKTIDSIKSPAILNVPMSRDSPTVPVEVILQKTVRDSISPVDLGKKNIQKDTLNNIKKTGKKKRRSKFSIFF